LYYYGLRYYAPWLMRWVSSDPEGFVDGLNLYCMVSNNSIGRVDDHGGQGSDFNDVPEELQLALLVMATLLAVVLTALNVQRGVNWIRDQFRAAEADSAAAAKAAAEAKTKAGMKRTSDTQKAIRSAESKYGLTEDETYALNIFYAVRNTPVEWVHLTKDRNGGLQIYPASSADQHRELANGRNPSSIAEKLGIKAIQLRSAPSPSSTVTNDAPANVDATPAPRASIDYTVSGSAELRAYQRLSQRKRGSTVSNASLDSNDEIAAPAPASSAARQIFTMDRSGFFEDANIVDWLGRRPGMEENLRAALDRFDPNRKGHTGLRGMKTTDIPSGTAGGRGDLRLGFTVRGNVFYPQAILSHKSKGTILAQRRA